MPFASNGHMDTGSPRGDGPAGLARPAKGTSWDRGLAALNSFVSREGHALVPQTHVEDGHGLGHWVAAQRQARRRGTLTDGRAAVLEALPAWSWDASGSRWDAAFRVLARFVAREGHAEVARRHVEQGFALGAWVSTQRVAYRQGRLRPVRSAALQALPGWTWDARSSR